MMEVQAWLLQKSNDPLNFAIGLVSSIVPFVLSVMERIEIGFRITSLLLGIVLALATIYLTVLRIKNERKKLKDKE